MKNVLCFISLLTLSVQCIAQAGYDTVKVYFPINGTQLNKDSKNRLDSTATSIQKKAILIYGFADYLGNEPANMDLAVARAQEVKKYLLSRKINPSQIMICEGIGEISRNIEKRSEGYPEDRRVSVFIKRASTVNLQTKETGSAAHKIKVSEISAGGTLIPIASNAAPIQKSKLSSSATSPAQNATKTERNKLNGAPRTMINSPFEQLTQLKPNEVMRVETIHFQPTRHFITRESESILKELLQTLKDNMDLAIRIEGHVCCMKGDGDALDTDTFELKLSENRARYIYEYLVQNGIDPNRLEYRGYGKQKPIIAIEKTEEDAQKNRRVEIRVLRN